MLFVASAGNSHVDTDVTPQFPSSFNNTNILSVAASDSLENLWSHSNFGKNTVQVMLSIGCSLPVGIGDPHLHSLHCLLMSLCMLIHSTHISGKNNESAARGKVARRALQPWLPMG